MTDFGPLTKLDTQLLDIVTKQSKLESLVIKSAPKIPVPDSVAVSAFKVVGPMLGPLWTLLGPFVKEQLGIRDNSIKEVLKALDEVKELQLQTLSVLEDLKSEVQSLDAVAAQDRLEAYLGDLQSLGKYDPKAQDEIEAERHRIRAEIKKTAREDLRAIDRALMGDKKPGITGFKRDGLLKHFYTRMEDNFDKNGEWTIPKFAQELDAYLFAAHQLQMHYFFLWYTSAYEKGNEEERRVRSEEFFERLAAQEKRFSSLRPLAVTYFTQDESAVSPNRRYRLESISQKDQFLHVASWDTAGPAIGHWVLSDINRTQLQQDPMSIASSYSSSAELKLCEWRRDQFPIKTTVTKMSGAGSANVELRAPKVYHSSGQIALSTWAEDWWAHKIWIPTTKVLEATQDRESRARLQIIPVHEVNEARPDEICVKLRMCDGERLPLASLYSKEGKYVLHVMDGDAPARYQSTYVNPWTSPFILFGKLLGLT